jgi:hypothetical protein
MLAKTDHGRLALTAHGRRPRRLPTVAAREDGPRSTLAKTASSTLAKTDPSRCAKTDPFAEKVRLVLAFIGAWPTR